MSQSNGISLFYPSFHRVSFVFLHQGRTFAKMIQDFVDIYSPLNETYLPLFATKEGKKVYEETLDAVKKQFPQYVREIEGTADGANVPFYKV